MTPQNRIEEYLDAIAEGWSTATVKPYPLAPAWRIEQFLDAFITYIWEDGDNPRHPCPLPVWHIEECVRAIYDVVTGEADPCPFPTPTNRIEEYLAAIYAYVADGTELAVPDPVWEIERWLAFVLGEVKNAAELKTITGTLLHFTNGLARPAVELDVALSPIQSLNGYDSPWPAGGGKNLYPNSSISGSAVGVTLTHNVDDESYKVSGLSEAYRGFVAESSFTLKAGTYTLSRTASSETVSANNLRMEIRSTDGLTTYASTVATTTFTLAEDTEVKARIVVGQSGIDFGAGITYRFQIEAGSSPTSWTPYSNICPITGRTGVSVYVSPTQNLADATTYALDWTTPAGTVYGGTVDVVTGVLTIDSVLEVFDDASDGASIASQINSFNKSSGSVGTVGSYTRISFATNNVDQTKYNRISNSYGTKICNMLKHSFAYNEESAHWYRNTALYAFFPTSLVGSTAQSVYDYLVSIKDTNPLSIWLELATPQTVQLTAQQLDILLGENNLWADGGETLTLTYYADGRANTLEALNLMLGNMYVNNHTPDDVSDEEALQILLGGTR